MKALPRPELRHVIAALLITAFLALLIFSLIRLREVEQTTRDNVSDNMLWVITQAQSAALKLDAEIALQALGTSEASDVAKRLDVLASRLLLLVEGPQHRYLEETGWATTLAAHVERFYDLERSLRGGEMRDAPELAHAVLQPMAADLGRAANVTMVHQWEQTGERLETWNRAVLQVILSSLALMCIGLLCGYALLRAHLHAQRKALDLIREQRLRLIYRQFVGLLSHQLRGPLAAIDASMQRIVRRGAEMPHGEIAARAARARRQISAMIELSDATLEGLHHDIYGSGQVAVATDPRRIAQDAIDTFALAAPNREVVLKTSYELVNEIHTDASLVRQILDNLLSNAHKFSPPDTCIEVSVQNSASALEFTVSDRGSGMTEGQFEDRLNSRLRSDPTGKEGRGIGLKLSYEIARLLGGELSLCKSEGAGTAFALRLPLGEENPTSKKSWPTRN